MPDNYWGIQSKQINDPAAGLTMAGTEQANQRCRPAPPPEPADQTRHTALRETSCHSTGRPAPGGRGGGAVRANSELISELQHKHRFEIF